jgi:hypothetical protein
MTAIDRLREILRAAGAAVSLAPLPAALRRDRPLLRPIPVRATPRRPLPTRH